MNLKKKKIPSAPQLRHTWKINPKTRVKASAKIYRRPGEKKKKPGWVDAIDWFGGLQ